MNPLLRLYTQNRARPGRQFEVKAAGADSAEVLLYDVIVADAMEAEFFGGVAPEPFVQALRKITAKTIHLRINSPGGSVFAARAMEQALREHPAQVVVHVDGVAASAASVIAMAGDQIIMGSGAMMMIHNGWSFAIGNAAEMRKTADLLDKVDGTLVQTYAARTRQQAQQVSDWMAAETWFTADEAVANGFADKVAAAPEPKAAAPATWNLEAYTHAPAAQPAGAPPAPAGQGRRTARARSQHGGPRCLSAPAPTQKPPAGWLFFINPERYSDAKHPSSAGAHERPRQGSPRPCRGQQRNLDHAAPGGVRRQDGRDRGREGPDHPAAEGARRARRGH
jgi:ATP-dependent Clp protease protease subunit